MLEDLIQIPGPVGIAVGDIDIDITLMRAFCIGDAPAIGDHVGRAMAAAAAAPHGRLAVIENAGHFVPVERPREHNAFVRNFLAETATSR